MLESKLPNSDYSIEVIVSSRTARLLYKDKVGYNDVIETEMYLFAEIEKCVESLIQKAHEHAVYRSQIYDIIDSRGWNSIVRVVL